MEWTWSPEHNDYYFAHYDAAGQVGYTWAKQQLPIGGTTAKRRRTDSPHDTHSGIDEEWATSGTPWHETLDATQTSTSRTASATAEGYKNVANPKAFFKKGRVFVTPWSEPKGVTEAANGVAEAAELTFTVPIRFVVVKPKASHCICLRVSTYSGQATTKPGVAASEHAAVLEEGQSFEEHSEGEPKLKEFPIYIKIENSDMTIHPMSRINFGRPYTVEYNVMIRNVGRVYGESIAKMEEYFAESLGLSKSSNTSKEQSIARAEATPAPSVPYDVRRSQPNFIAGNPERGWYDSLDNSYRMRTGPEAKSFFVVGRVFSMLYTEAASAVARVAPDDDAFTVVRFGEHVHTQIRRFIVVSVRRNFVHACAISTYKNQGTLKRGCDPREHALIYNTGINPEICYLPGEKERGLKDPIQVHPADSSALLTKESRIRFGKIYSIEFNVKVKDVGLVVNEDLNRLLNHHQEENR